MLRKTDIGVQIVGNFLTDSVGTYPVCQDLADRLKQTGWRVITTSRKLNRLARLKDMVATVYRKRKQYEVAQVDVYSGLAFFWAEAVCYGRLTQDIEKRNNVGVIFKRAEGVGSISRIEGLESLLAHYGEHMAHIDLVPIGQPRRDYRQVVEGDGWVVVRHPDLETTIEMTNRVATDLRMYAS